MAPIIGDIKAIIKDETVTAFPHAATPASSEPWKIAVAKKSRINKSYNNSCKRLICKVINRPGKNCFFIIIILHVYFLRISLRPKKPLNVNLKKTTTYAITENINTDCHKIFHEKNILK